MKKELRQAKIEQLINQRPLANQEELMAALKEVGISATQATISRDIREMQIVKQQDAQGHLRYMIFKAHNSSEQDKLNKAIYDSVTAVILVEFMNVIHTTPRSANVLAAILDDLALDDIAGTVAGFDTVVVISPTRESAMRINTLFNEHLAHDELI